jgi:hypothetical protein
MPMTVWKFPFHIRDRVAIEMPQGASVLHVECQRGQPTIWALCDPYAASKLKLFRIFGTGHQIERPQDLRFCGTFQTNEGALVWHLFEENK